MEDISRRTFYRYMSEGEVEVVRRTELLRGGRPGKTFWTTDFYEGALEARRFLALGSLPEVRLTFRIVGEPKLELNGAVVEPTPDEPGGGAEYMSRGKVEVEVVAVDRIE
jgi:hypothetical protein